MSKPLPTQNTFANLAPPWSLVTLDGNFTNIWSAINDIGTYSNTLTDTGSVNVLVATPAGGLTFNLVTGIAVDIIVGNTTTTTGPTLNVNGTGAKVIVNPDGSALRQGALLAGGIYRFVYDGANWKAQTLGFGNTTIISKPSATTRTNTTTPTNDPDLTFNIVIGGVYMIKVLIGAFQASAGSVGINCNINFSGTLGSSRAHTFGQSAGGLTGNTGGVQSAVSNVALSIPALSTFEAPIQIDAVASLNTTGTLAFAWAQNTSSGTATTVNTASFLLLQRIG